MSNAGPIEVLVHVFGDALSALEDLVATPDAAAQTLEQIGLRLPEGSLGTGNVAGALQTAAAACGRLPDAVTALVNAVTASDDTAMIAAAVELAQRIVQAINALADLGSDLNNVVGNAPGLTAAQRSRLATAAQEAPTRLAQLALITLLKEQWPGVKAALEIAGLIDDTPVPADVNDPLAPPFSLAKLRFDRLTTLLQNPVDHLKSLYGFGQANFDGLELFRRVAAVLARPDAQPILITAPGVPAALEAFLFRLAIQPGATPALRVRLRINASRDVQTVQPIGGPWSLTLNSSARFGWPVELVIDPHSGLHIEPPSTPTTLTVAAGIQAQRADGSPMILIGQAAGSRIEISGFTASLPLKLTANAGAASPNVALSAEVALPHGAQGQGGKLVIDTSDADSFISTLLGGAKLESGFDLGAIYDLQHGLQLTGSGGIEVSIPAHLDLGPVSISTIYLVGGFGGGGVSLEFSADMSASLGPLQASVNRLGAQANMSFPAKGGNAGPVQIDIGFKAPTGAGLSIDAGIVSGGGFLSIDTARGEYSGALQLQFADLFAVTAIGLIDTKNPDGSPGFSLLIIITADFGAGIQLGFGFTLNKVGGLIGLNRGMAMQALMDGVRTDAIESVMFPTNVIANAPKIISDLRTFFPPHDGTFLIGPMAQFGWGEPTLASGSLGVIVEIPPGDIAILGVIKVALPADQLAILVLQVNFAGAIEPDKKRLYFYAELYDSHVLFITIGGGMGLLVAWGDDANFVVSVGGFHPQYKPPPLPFPTPDRISVDILNESFARIHADGYFAVTSNTVQFGAHADMFFGFSALSVQGDVGFDALIQFSPFYFTVEISASFSVKVFGMGLFGIGIDAALSGPTPWHVHGTATLQILFFSIGIGIDVSWGDSRNTTLPPVKVMPILVAELGKQSNWKAVFAPGNDALVVLRQLSPTVSQTVLHPAGTLQISQQAVPLDLVLDKFGAQQPSDANRFTLSVSSPDLAKTRDLQAPFAPAQFKNLADAAKLSQPGYAPQDSGVELAGAGELYATGTAVCREVRYDETVLDTDRRVFIKFRHYPGSLFRYGLRGNAAARSPVSAAIYAQTHPFDGAVTVSNEAFVVAHTDTNTAYTTTTFTSQASAADHIDQLIAADPTLAGTLHVLPQFEVAP